MKKISLLIIATSLVLINACKKSDVVAASTSSLTTNDRIFELHLNGSYAYGLDEYDDAIYSYFEADSQVSTGDLSSPRDIYANDKITFKTQAFGKMPLNYPDLSTSIKILANFYAGSYYGSNFNYNNKISYNKDKYKITYKFKDPSIVQVEITDGIGLEIGIRPLKIGQTELNVLIQYTPTAGGPTYTQVNQSFLFEIK